MSVHTGKPSSAPTQVIQRQIQYMDTTDSPAVLYNGDTGLLDQSGNGHDLTLNAGSFGIADIMPGNQALYIPVGCSLRVPVSSSDFQIAGDVTIIATVLMDQFPNASTGIIFCGQSGTLEVNNHMYLCQFRQTTGAVPRRMRFFWEHGSGVDDDFDTDGDESLPPVHTVVQAAWRRSGSTGQMFSNGRAIGSASTGLTAPTGGSGGILQIGGVNQATNNDAAFLLHSIQVVPSALSDARITEIYNNTVGPVFGEV